MSAGLLMSLRPRSGRSLSVGAIAGIVVCVAALAGAALIASHSSSQPGTTIPANERAQRVALVSWESAIHPSVVAAGQVVALGPRTGVSDVANRTQPDAKLRAMATGWASRLTVLASQITAVTTPVFLTSVHELLDNAMSQYVAATHALVAATSARGARRTSLLVAATAHGKNGDHLYDEAAAAIAGWRARLGLAPDWSAS